MKIKILCILLVALTLMSVFCSCDYVDPKVKHDEEITDSSDTAETQKSETVSEDETKYMAYGDGMEHTETVKGVEINADEFALRGYELAFLLAQKKFSKVEEIPVDALVQFAFCHLFYENLYEMPHEGVVYKDAKYSEIKDIVEKYFGKNSVDLKKSVLYNSGKKKFEMWQPGYGTNVYYTIDAVNVKGSKVVIEATFYNEESKNTLKGTIEITVQVKDGKAIIAKLDAK